MKEYMQATMNKVRGYIDSEMKSAPEERTRRVLGEFEDECSFSA